METITKKVKNDSAPNQQFIKVPFNVLACKELLPNEKLLYGLIKSYSKQSGYCFASRKHLAIMLGVSPSTVTNLVSGLEEKGFITAKTVYANNWSYYQQRHLYLTDKEKSLEPPNPKHAGEVIEDSVMGVQSDDTLSPTNDPEGQCTDQGNQLTNLEGKELSQGGQSTDHPSQSTDLEGQSDKTPSQSGNRVGQSDIPVGQSEGSGGQSTMSIIDNTNRNKIDNENTDELDNLNSEISLDDNVSDNSLSEERIKLLSNIEEMEDIDLSEYIESYDPVWEKLIRQVEYKLEKSKKIRDFNFDDSIKVIRLSLPVIIKNDITSNTPNNVERVLNEIKDKFPIIKDDNNVLDLPSV